MKRLSMVLVCMAILHGQAFAYLNDVVAIHESTKDKSPQAAFMMREAAIAIEDALFKDFPCLKISTTGETKKALDALKEKELIGPMGRQWIDAANSDNTNPLDRTTNQEDEAFFRESIQKKIAELGKRSQSKYLILIRTTATQVVNLRVSAMNNYWTKKSGYFYQENKIYPSAEAAIADIGRIAGDLVKAFVEKASNDKWNNEVCPFKGKVEVRATTQRKQEKKDTFFDYCNGQDQQGSKSESFTGDGKQFWKFERYGNPDTNGTMEGTMSEKIVREETTGCHECGSGRKGAWSFRDETESTGSASGLDTSTYTLGKSDNKDATIRLHFSSDGTYKVSIRAVSNEGTKYVTRTTTAAGTCDNLNKKPKSEKQPITIPLEQQFGPFSGTVRDKRLKDKRVLVIDNKRTEETTEYTIEFDLKRPDGKS